MYVSGLIAGGVGQIQTGRLLDRNPQIGSGGYNVVSGGVGGVSTQLFMNRQVRGLGLFRGDVPYYRFRAAPAAIRAPGTFAQDHRRTVGLALAKSLYVDATADYMSLAVVPAGQGILAGVPLGPVDTRRDLAPQATPPQRPPERPGASALFGILWQEDRRQLAAQLQQLPMDQPIDARMDSQAWPPGLTDVETGGLMTAEPGPLGVAQTTPAKLFEPGQDAFMDILTELRSLRKAEAVARTAEGKPGTTTAPAAESAVKKAKDEKIVHIHALAGQRRNKFNLYLAEGQRLLKEGRYYSAAHQFELAAIARPTNPLARVGWGLAMLSAGELLSAAVHFRSAIEIFPPIMETCCNFAEMTDAEHIKNRTTEVNRIVNAQPRPDAMLAFLATYLPFNARRAVAAKFYAKKLAQAAGDDKILAAYAKFVLTGKRPDRPEEKADKKRP